MRPRSRLRSGAAMVFVVVMVGLCTVAVLASVQLTTSASAIQAKRESDARARYAFEGASQLCLSDLRTNNTSVPSTKTYTIGDHKVTLTVTDNSASLARTVRIDAQVTILGRNHKFTRIVGNRLDPHPLFYALFIDDNLDPNRAITVGLDNTAGDTCINGSVVARSNPFTIYGDLETMGTTVPVGATITGNTVRSAARVPFPALNAASYLAASALSLPLSALNGYGFPVVEPYQLLYRLGNLDISGAFSGKGTIFVQGDVLISANISYSSASSRLVVIATGKIEAAASVTSIVGFFYSATEFKTVNPATLAISPGGLATKRLTLNGPITITNDPVFWNYPAEGKRHWLPGMWP
jgi:hypothetical protein